MVELYSPEPPPFRTDDDLNSAFETWWMKELMGNRIFDSFSNESSKVRYILKSSRYVQHLHLFSDEELSIFGDCFLIDDVRRILYLEFTSRSRIWTFVNKILKTESIFSVLSDIEKKGYLLAGVVYGSGSRFESSSKSDWDAPMFLWGKNSNVFAYEGREAKHFLSDSLSQLRTRIERQRLRYKIFDGVELCGLVDDWSAPARSFEFALQVGRRAQSGNGEGRKSTWFHSYLIGYPFYESSPGLLARWKDYYVREVGVDTILKFDYLRNLMKKEKKMDDLLSGNEVPYYDFKKTTWNLLEGLSLLLLREKAGGSSLIHDFITCWHKNLLTRDQTKTMLISVLEVYKQKTLHPQNVLINDSGRKGLTLARSFLQVA